MKKDKYKFYAYIADNDGKTTLSVKFRNNETSIQGKYLTPKRGRDYTAVLSKEGNGYNFITLYMKRDEEVVKQSGAVLVRMLICVGLVVISVLPMLAIGSDWVAIAVSAAILAGAIGVYLYLRDRAEQFRRNL